MIIRFAQLKDKKQVLKLLDELIFEVNKKMGSSKHHTGNEKRSALYEKLLKRDDVKIFVVEENNKLIGVAELFIVPILRRGYSQAVLESFVITQNIRGKGIGSALMEKIISFCRENNISVIKLTSGIELTDAHRFYEKHGGKFTEKLFRFNLK